MSLIVTGASGRFARLATAMLLERLPPSELICVTRRPEALTALAARGVRVRAGDFDEPDELRAAFEGGTRMLLISTLSVGRRADQHIRAINAAAAAGVRHIAYTSSGGANPQNPAIVIADHLKTEQALEDSGLPYTLLRDSLYIEAPLHHIAPRALQTGMWIASAGEGRVGFVAKKDCAACAVQVLTTPGHEGKTYEITGPELLSFRDVARIASEVDGRPIEFREVTDDEMAAMLTAMGVPQHYEDGMFTQGVGTSSVADIVSYEQGIRGGHFAILSDHVRQILGRPPVSLRETFLANKAALRRSAL
ncbi:MAG TPA: SDR family oxidoreductase [Steroidobacteraceae bacterium]